jgi:hypothetical protein
MIIRSRNHKIKIALAALPILLTTKILVSQNTSALFAQNSQSSPGGNNQTSTDKQRLSRVHAKKLDGFELSRKSSDSATQVAGASRSFGTETTLLAPHKGRAYALTPFFQWSNPNGKIKSYRFRLLASDHQSVIYETEVPGTSWKYPQDAPPLKPGSSYFWTVQPSIKVLGEAAEAAEIMFEGGAGRAKLTDKLASLPEWSQQRAKVLVEGRIWYDAIETYTHLIGATASDSRLLELRAELYDQLPQTSQAAENDRSRAGMPQQ